MRSGKKEARKSLARGPRAGTGRSPNRLGGYARKRNFGRTPEPSAGRAAAKRPDRPIYVVQRHQASRLHFDLRLEESGVLKSWAVPKEPPLTPGVRRLAVETEDHPLAYADFEGTIPQGEYGAGTVTLWDSGIYEPLEVTPGKRVVRIYGRRLKGRYALIKLRPKEGGDKNWLFFKLQGNS